MCAPARLRVRLADHDLLPVAGQQRRGAQPETTPHSAVRGMNARVVCESLVKRYVRMPLRGFFERSRESRPVNPTVSGNLQQKLQRGLLSPCVA